MIFSGYLLRPQASGQAERSASDAADAKTQAELTRMSIEFMKRQAELKRAEADIRRSSADAAAAGGARFTTGVPPIFVGGGMSRRQESMMFVGFVVVVIAAVAILNPLIRIFGRRYDRGRQNVQIDAATAAQLQRIEHAVEAMAVEIERLSEGQRFTTKLLAGRAESESLINRR
jgi:hypothetical protein